MIIGMRDIKIACVFLGVVHLMYICMYMALGWMLYQAGMFWASGVLGVIGVFFTVMVVKFWVLGFKKPKYGEVDDE